MSLFANYFVVMMKENGITDERLVGLCLDLDYPSYFNRSKRYRNQPGNWTNNMPTLCTKLRTEGLMRYRKY